MAKLYALIKVSEYTHTNVGWDEYFEYTTDNTEILGYSTNLEELEYIQSNYDLEVYEELFVREINEITKEDFIKEQRYIKYSSWIELKRNNGHFVHDNIIKNEPYEVFSVDKNSYSLDTIIIDVHISDRNTITIFVEMRSEYSDMEDVFISTVDSYVNKLNFLLSNLKNADVRSTRKVVESIKKLK
ncbi:hypothetical protein TwortDSMZ_031 [Staphylococcus phage Twort]|uniref:ORF068 n=2 Tax=Staphylococcus phage Twort (strain DSM 17442 / HER 48) TaxID=2908167 RepID=Q4Z927_BPTWO|nr:hypothetical protein TwortORF068 [Staphylococcus phage Twort]AAX92363.1 ORF068 [Staphylococcus phage Twort]QIW89040.1 hypothetical protein TwortDSMZ_031 [Staphylococcus phage Twort]